MMDDRGIREIEKDAKAIIERHLESIKDPIKQFTAYLTWIVQIKYVIELRIGWEEQGFGSKYSFDRLFDISFELTKQEYD